MIHWFNPSTFYFTSTPWNQSRFRTKKARSSSHHRHVKQYQLLQELGQGSTSVIYLARNRKNKKLYAVKEMNMIKLQRQACLDWLQARNPKQRQVDGCKRRRLDVPPPVPTTAALSTESVLLQSLHHENIVEWVDCFEENNNLYLVTEWIDSSVLVNLHDTDRTYPLLDSSILHSIFTQLVLTLDYLHKKNIIHGDIKPDNVLLTKTNQIKLIDFGSAIRLNTTNNDNDNSIYTQSIQRRRTPAFTPPECNAINKKDLLHDHHDTATIKHYETATDIWSLGMTLYCMVYGKLPYQREMTSSHNHKNSKHCDLLENFQYVPHQDTIDQDLCDLIDQMLEREPMERITLDQIKQHPWFLSKKSNTDSAT